MRAIRLALSSFLFFSFPTFAASWKTCETPESFADITACVQANKKAIKEDGWIFFVECALGAKLRSAITATTSRQGASKTNARLIFSLGDFRLSVREQGSDLEGLRLASRSDKWNGAKWADTETNSPVTATENKCQSCHTLAGGSHVVNGKKLFDYVRLEDPNYRNNDPAAFKRISSRLSDACTYSSSGDPTSSKSTKPEPGESNGEDSPAFPRSIEPSLHVPRGEGEPSGPHR